MSTCGFTHFFNPRRDKTRGWSIFIFYFFWSNKFYWLLSKWTNRNAAVKPSAPVKKLTLWYPDAILNSIGQCPWLMSNMKCNFITNPLHTCRGKGTRHSTFVNLTDKFDNRSRLVINKLIVYLLLLINLFLCCNYMKHHCNSLSSVLICRTG